jgi:hypothetical protein
MPTAIGKKLRSRKVQLACEKRQSQLADKQSHGMIKNEYRDVQQHELQPLNARITTETEGGAKLEPSAKALKLSAHSVNDVEVPGSSSCGHEKDALHPVIIKGPATSGETATYDTVTSIHDIEQDDHIYYANEKKDSSLHPLLTFERKLGKIIEVPSKNITRNNSLTDLEYANTKI